MSKSLSCLQQRMSGTTQSGDLVDAKVVMAADTQGLGRIKVGEQPSGSFMLVESEGWQWVLRPHCSSMPGI